jgi:hypothetical protein
MLKKAVLLGALAILVTGCASVPMESKQTSDDAKRFAAPAQGQAGLYIYRGGGPGAALTKALWVDGKCVGTTAPNVFFYEQVKGDQEHTIATQSEFSNNELKLAMQSGINYFVRQYIKLGVFVGGANLEVVSEADGQAAIKELEMATKGKCSQ